METTEFIESFTDFFEFLFFIFMIWICYKHILNQFSLEKILRKRNFIQIQRVPARQFQNRILYTAHANSMNYLFIKTISNSSIQTLTHEELKQYVSISSTLKCDRIIIYINSLQIPIELTKKAALYNIELWNKDGTSNFNTYSSIQHNTNTSILANTLKPNNAIYEHKPNGVIAKDTCHIVPSTSPIIEKPSSLFHKKKTQRL